MFYMIKYLIGGRMFIGQATARAGGGEMSIVKKRCYFVTVTLS
jgi:hypothetical protein